MCACVTVFSLPASSVLETVDSGAPASPSRPDKVSSAQAGRVHCCGEPGTQQYGDARSSSAAPGPESVSGRTRKRGRKLESPNYPKDLRSLWEWLTVLNRTELTGLGPTVSPKGMELFLM